MGRHAKDEAWHSAMGTESKAAPVTDSSVPAGRPTCPKFLLPAAKKKFRQLCKQLSERRVLTDGDQTALVLAAVQYDRWTRNLEKANTEGEITQYESRDRNGNAMFREKKSLALTIAQESEKQMLAILVQLGLTPVMKDRPKQAGPVGEPEYAPGTIGFMLQQGAKK